MRPGTLLRLLTFLAVGGISIHAQIWTRDPSFAPTLLNDRNAVGDIGFVSAPDGRVLLVGNFTHLENTSVANRQLAYVRADGTVDSSFVSSVASTETIYTAVPLSGGRVLAQRSVNDGSKPAELVRYLANGQLDTTFTPIACPYRVKSTVAPDGRVYLWNAYLTLDGTQRRKLARLTPEGTIDPTFQSALYVDSLQVYAIAPTTDGKVIVSEEIPFQSDPAPHSRVLRLNTDGSIDNTFTTRIFSGPVYGALAVAANGSVLAGSAPLPRYTAVAPSDGASVAGKLVRLTATGADDATWNSQITNLQGVERVVIRSDGQILVQAATGTGAGPWASSVYLLSANGAVQRDLRNVLPSDHTLRLGCVLSNEELFAVHGRPTSGYAWTTTFLTSSVAASATTVTTEGATTISPTPSNPVTLGGTSTVAAIAPTVPTTTVPIDPTLARVSADGASATETGLTVINRSPGWVGYVRTDAQNRLVILGQFTSVNGVPRPGLARFNANGTLDTTFAPSLHGTVPSSLLLLAPDGSMYLLGNTLGPRGSDGLYSYTLTLLRVRADGTLDETFAPPFPLASQYSFHAVGADGRILVSYFSPDNNQEENLRISWLGTDGKVAQTLPTRFGGLSQLVTIAADTPHTNTDSAQVNVIPGLNPGLYGNPFQFVQPLSDGQYLVGGMFKTVNNVDRPWLARLKADGSLDPTYTPDLSGFVSVIFPRLDQKGRVTVWGSLWVDGRVQYGSARLLANGTRDPNYYSLPSYPDSALLRLDNGLPDLNFPSKITDADGTLKALHTAIVADEGTAWTVDPLARFTPSDVPSITVPPQDQTVVAGNDAVFLVGLGTRHDAAYQWLFEDQPIAGATRPVLWLTGVTATQAGHYKVRVTVDGQTLTSAAAILTVQGGTARIVNLSARANVSAGAPLIAGFTIGNDGSPRKWLIRAMGPTLSKFGVTGPLPDPELGLFNSTSEIGRDQGGALGATVIELATQVGAFPPDIPYPLFPTWRTKESALTPVLAPGNYTAHITTPSGSSGPALLEIYDTITRGASGSLTNIALRSRITGGANTPTLGFVIAGNAPAQLLIRGVGPTLVKYGLTNALSDPVLKVYSGQITVPIASNAGWGNATDLAEAAKRVGAFDLNAGSRDTAVIIRLSPGAYTAQLTSASGLVGEGLIEVYLMSP